LEQIFVLLFLLIVRELIERSVLVVLVDRHESIDDPVVVPEEAKSFVSTRVMKRRREERVKAHLEKTIMRAQVEGGIRNNL
jgi:hypothetical protein